MSQTSVSSPKKLLQQPLSWLYSLWKFARPHTIIGTTLSVLALYLIALATTNSSLTSANIGQCLAALIACWCGNVYIVGLNQLEDVAIDQINKPHLPLAAGEFSRQQGNLIVVATGVLALIIATWQGGWLLATVGISLTLGTAYSLPPLRLKRFPFWAAFCIFTVRGVIVNLGLFLHFSSLFSQRSFLSAPVWALTLFVLIFTIAIAIFKDVPDMEGDKQYQITTFTLLVGKQTVFNVTRGVISICYLGMILAGIFWLPTINSWFLTITQAGLLGLLWWRSWAVDLQDKVEIAKFYQFIWKLFFWEYLLFPAACLIS